MPVDHHRPPPLHQAVPELMRPVPVDPTGRSGPTPKQARGPRWRRTSPGLYLPSDVDPDSPGQRAVEAAAACAEGDAVTGWAALQLWGGRWFGGSDRGSPVPVPLVVGRRTRRPWPGVVVSRERFDADDLGSRWGLRLTTPVASVVFEMRHAEDLLGAVRAVDMAAFNDLVSLEEVRRHLAVSKGRHGIERARLAVELADENTWSPMETLMRWVWTQEAGLPTPLTNTPVFDQDGRLVATPDLLDPATGVYGEYDGDGHLDRQQRTNDVRREASLRALGLEGVTMLASDTVDHGPFLARLREACRRAEARPADARRWSVQPPGWWWRTDTVEARRALPDRQRERLLAHRRGPVPSSATPAPFQSPKRAVM